jgi:hypothetical protein
MKEVYKTSGEKSLDSFNDYLDEFTPELSSYYDDLHQLGCQAFALCRLEDNGEMTPENTYGLIKQLCQKLNLSEQYFN